MIPNIYKLTKYKIFICKIGVRELREFYGPVVVSKLSGPLT